MPADVKTRAQEYLKATGGNGMGAYTGSSGLEFVRQQVAAFIERRDGFPSDPSAISLTTGASEAVKRCISALIRDPEDGIMIPCPQYLPAPGTRHVSQNPQTKTPETPRLVTCRFIFSMRERMEREQWCATVRV